MSTPTDTLIASLTTGLQPVQPPRLGLTTLLWLGTSIAFVVGITHLLGPIRPTALNQLATEPRFLIEMMFGGMAIVVTAVLAFRSTIPGATSRVSLLIGPALIVLWLANYVIGFAYPTLEPSMLGKRDHCFMEAWAFGLVPAGLAYLFSRRFYPLDPVYSSTLFCLAAGMLPALYMQIACMYEPTHILKMHIVPGLVMPFTGFLVAWAWRRKRRLL